MGEVLEVKPRGITSPHEVGWSAGVSADRIGQWARRGYIRSSVSPVVPLVYSYQDVAEAMAVHELILRGTSLRRIKRAVELLRDDYGDWPLTSAPLVTAELRGQAGPSAALLLQGNDGLADLHRDPYQGVLKIGELRRIASDPRRGGWAVRRLPDLRHVEVDPDRLSGRPTIRGTRVPAELGAKLASREEGRMILKSDYGVTERQIRDAQRWWDAVDDMTQAA